jgi:hypothetical protein
MKKTQGWHVWTITDVEEQGDVIHNHKIQMILAREKQKLISARKDDDLATKKR